MDWSLYARGLLIGLAVAAPVGPMSVLCMRRTIAHGQAVGLLSGLGIASADATYSAVAALGLTAVSSLVVAWQDPIRVSGGLFLIYLGWRATRSETIAQTTVVGSARGQKVGAFISTFGLTMTNPATTLSFVAIFSGAGFVAQERDLFAAILLVTGVFTGSSLWWIVLVSAIGRLRGQLRPRFTIIVNRAAVVVILTFGAIAVASGLR